MVYRGDCGTHVAGAPARLFDTLPFALTVARSLVLPGFGDGELGERGQEAVPVGRAPPEDGPRGLRL